jgi:xanthine dehydrogenase YagS FAD-binding subunit
MSRAWAEWPLVEVVVRLMMDGDSIRDARIGLGGVANIPFRLTEVESALVGRPASQQTFEAAARHSIQRANPLPQTGYKLDMVVALVLEGLESAASGGGGRVEFAV